MAPFLPVRVEHYTGPGGACITFMRLAKGYAARRFSDLNSSYSWTQADAGESYQESAGD